MTPVDELVSSKAKMIGVGKKNTNVLNFLNYKPSFLINCQMQVNEFTLDATWCKCIVKL